MMIDCDSYAVGQAFKRERQKQRRTTLDVGNQLCVHYTSVVNRENQGMQSLELVRRYWAALGYDVQLSIVPKP